MSVCLSYFNIYSALYHITKHFSSSLCFNAEYSYPAVSVVSLRLVDL